MQSQHTEIVESFTEEIVESFTEEFFRLVEFALSAVKQFSQLPRGTCVERPA